MPQPSPPALLAPVPRTSTAVLLAKVAAWRGLDVVAVPPERGERDLHWYGGPLAAARVTGRLGVGLLEPHDDWLSTLPYELTRRRIELTTLAEAWQLQAPAFVKPPSDKSVPAAVYADGTRLPKDGDRIGPETPVLVSEVVEFAAEYRLFVLDGQVRTGSRYAVHGRLDPAPLDPAARDFAGELLRQSAHPAQRRRRRHRTARRRPVGRCRGQYAVVRAELRGRARPCARRRPTRLRTPRPHQCTRPSLSALNCANSCASCDEKIRISLGSARRSSRSRSSCVSRSAWFSATSR